MDKFSLIKVLSYDRFHNTELHWGDRILIHQYNNKGLEMHPVLKLKVNRIIDTIKAEKWEIPEYKFNAAREIEVYNPDTERWKVFKKDKTK